ncbi:hypothetical protein DFH07DRAFT_727882 [Mycena maculata]|uniref:LYR motif-containing protein Cup1-like N-terminal domain-containing protein n=1 Tax=Mycena maculata TaxID=230809 RepID=A0AAD7P1D1_9AGAR|nr:hypothetical protein DFH07DRAFT_727882 [Mycena maculata]
MVVFHTNQAIFALYRAFVRESRKLPHLYLRQFWGIKGSDDVRAILKTENPHHVRDRKFKRMAKDLRKLEAANKQKPKAFDHVLDVAYGRKGKLRRELMEPILTDPTAPIPAKIIPAVESSRPPVYSKELTALLTSGASRTVKRPLTEGNLAFPSTLPPRANPHSDEAHLFGPFSKRRETNARWRYFVDQWQKVRPPLQVVVEDRAADSKGVSLDDVHRAGIRSLPLQGLHIFEDVENIAHTPTHGSKNSAAPDNSNVSRWVRRRYQKLLNRIPILTCTIIHEGKPPGYSVSLSPNHFGSQQTKIAEADSSDLEWIAESPPPAAKSAARVE